MTDDQETLMDDIEKEMERVMTLLTYYESVPAGALRAVILRNLITQTEMAIPSSDIELLLRLYEQLKKAE